MLRSNYKNLTEYYFLFILLSQYSLSFGEHSGNGQLVQSISHPASLVQIAQIKIIIKTIIKINKLLIPFKW